MGLLDTLKSWLGFGDRADSNEAAAPTDETSSEEPKLDPNGATETRVKSTDSAVDALKQTRSEAAETAAGDVADGDEPAPDGETADANPEQ